MGKFQLPKPPACELMVRVTIVCDRADCASERSTEAARSRAVAEVFFELLKAMFILVYWSVLLLPGLARQSNN